MMEVSIHVKCNRSKLGSMGMGSSPEPFSDAKSCDIHIYYMYLDINQNVRQLSYKGNIGGLVEKEGTFICKFSHWTDSALCWIKKTSAGSLKPLIVAHGELWHGFSVVVILQHSNDSTTK